MGEIMIAACGMGTEEPVPCETPVQCRDGGCARLRARDVAQVAEVAYLRGMLDSCVCGALITDETWREVEAATETAKVITFGATPIVANERIPKGSIVVATTNGDAVAFPFDASNASENRTIAEPRSITDRLRRIESLLLDGVAEGGSSEVRAALVEVRSILGGE